MASSGYLKVKHMSPAEYEDITHDDIISGHVKLFSDCNPDEGDDRTNMTALKIFWVFLLQWLREAGSGAANAVAGKFRLFCNLFATPDMQTRGYQHHVSQTGKARRGEGMYAKHGWVSELVNKCQKAYAEAKMQAAIAGLGEVPWTMYCARFAAGSAAVGEIKRGRMRTRFRAPSKKEAMDGRVLLSASGMPGFGYVFGKSVQYDDVWNDQKATGEHIPRLNGTWEWTKEGRVVVNGGVIGMEIVGVELPDTFPYTQFWPSAGLEPDNDIDRMTIRAYFWEDVLKDRVKLLAKMTQPGVKVAEEAKMATHGYSWFRDVLWKQIHPKRSPFAGLPLERWEEVPKIAKDVENYIAQWMVDNEPPPFETSPAGKEGLAEDKDVWTQIVTWLKSVIAKDSIKVGDISRGIVAKDEDVAPAAAAAMWKGWTSNFSCYRVIWGTSRFAPAHVLAMDLIMNDALTQADLDGYTDIKDLRDEFALLKAEGKAMDTSHMEFMRGMQRRFGVIGEEKEEFDPSVKDLFTANEDKKKAQAKFEEEKALKAPTPGKAEEPPTGGGEEGDPSDVPFDDHDFGFTAGDGHLKSIRSLLPPKGMTDAGNMTLELVFNVFLQFLLHEEFMKGISVSEDVVNFMIPTGGDWKPVKLKATKNHAGHKKIGAEEFTLIRKVATHYYTLLKDMGVATDGGKRARATAVLMAATEWDIKDSGLKDWVRQGSEEDPPVFWDVITEPEYDDGKYHRVKMVK